MKQRILAISSFILISSLFLSFGLYNSNGMAGYTGAPGEATCSNCHSGGISASSGVTISSVPAFSNNTFYPDSIYQIIITASASGFTRYGFDCVVLSPSNTATGSMAQPGAGVKFAFGAGRMHAVHSTPKIAGTGVATFTFNWTAPSNNATFYAIANAVNGNNNTSGDFVIPKVSLALTAVEPPIEPPIPDAIADQDAVNALRLFPNPSSGNVTVSFFQSGETSTIEVLDLHGRQIRPATVMNDGLGMRDSKIDVSGLPGGVYMVRISAPGRRAISRPLIIN
jgi:hypothetical protein